MSGLRPQTRYTVRLSVLNGVSDQDSAGVEGRRSEVMATTGDISMYCDIRILKIIITIELWHSATEFPQGPMEHTRVHKHFFSGA